MTEHAEKTFLIPSQPSDFPGLVAYWEFNQPGHSWRAIQGEPYTLTTSGEPLQITRDKSVPLGGSAIVIPEGTWLTCPRSECPKLDIHGENCQLTVIAWLRRESTQHGGCEFIAGQWNESQLGRQYGLFLNISVWRQHHQITGHLSNVGGPTPGYKYCIDGAVGQSAVPCDEWSVVAMSYDGSQGYVWLNGALDVRPGLNPYSMAGGLHDGGSSGSDFTVAGVDRSGCMGNFFKGQLAGLATYNRALTPAEIYALSTCHERGC
ncbi:LamG-like jellyroll fold domain-containing protein [Coraliomargarita algicola]|uniref:LamG-like jellyroll fold domain-containing protein n=1 Tax=Coraliomargarita algicola TaxID=3092156 RepID=A0ABZ0RP06_9BACT|nr:LamG-like jellyroll fold domain-containing protein [Coraliomargarita sp. J2-16]WPJ97257.1 LamG-like jellyroll fold domain-containing protein [Coraliomargarita sp. J2-16]